MSGSEPNNRHLREILIYFFNLKKSAAEAHLLLVETYDEAALNKRSCREWFQKFTNVNLTSIRTKHKKNNTLENTSNKT